MFIKSNHLIFLRFASVYKPHQSLECLEPFLLRISIIQMKPYSYAYVCNHASHLIVTYIPMAKYTKTIQGISCRIFKCTHNVAQNNGYAVPDTVAVDMQ